MNIDNGYYDDTMGKSYLVHENNMFEIEPSRYMLCVFGEVIEWGILKLSYFERFLYWLIGGRYQRS